MEETLERVRAGEADPRCPKCEGILKSATISFGQSLVTEDLLRAENAIRKCDLLLAVGTSLTVGPINKVVPLAHSLSTPVVIINGEKTEYEYLATLVLHADITETLQRVCS